MKQATVKLKDGTQVTIKCAHGGLPVLRLLQYHAHDLVIEVWRAPNDPFTTNLGMINFEAPRVLVHEPFPPKADTVIIAPAKTG